MEVDGLGRGGVENIEKGGVDGVGRCGVDVIWKGGVRIGVNYVIV